MQTNLKSLVQMRQESQSSQAAQRNNSAVSIVERPTPPAHGKSLRKPVLALAVMVAGFTALCVGLVRVFLRRGFATRDSASRTLDLPVLATAGVKAR